MADMVFRSFWHGATLGLVNRLCLSSFVRSGFQVELFSYTPVADIPKGVIARDASEILPCERIFVYTRGYGAGSPSLHSNLFRYKLLRDLGGWWIDADVLLLRGPIPEDEYVFSRESEMLVGTAVVRAPAGSDLMRRAFDLASGLVEKDPGWSVTGPDLLTEMIYTLKLHSKIKPASFAYEIGYKEAQKFLRPEDFEEVSCRTRNSQFAHLWAQMLKAHYVPSEMLPPTGSFLDQQAKLNEIEPRDLGRPSASEFDAIWQAEETVKDLRREIAKKEKDLLTELRWRVSAGQTVVIPLVAFQSNTGERRGGAIECIPAKHAAGHCLYGADLEISTSGTYRVTYEIEQISDAQVGNGLMFDVYENSIRKCILAQTQLSQTHPKSFSRQEVCLEFGAEEDFRVEFRAFWCGDTPIRILSVSVEKIFSSGAIQIQKAI